MTEGKADMLSIKKRLVSANTMLARYLLDGTYADCYSTDILGQVTFSDFIFAFYTTSLFKLERFILKFTVLKPSTDAQARQLADGELETFAAWHVEDRKENELLMCDFLGRTRSWLMIVPVNDSRTRLYFGSAVVPKQNSKSIGLGFRALLGFHKIYSRLLLYSAKLRIKSRLSREH